MNKKKVIISWLMVIIWMGTIFYLSSMNTGESNGKSKKVIDKVVTTTIDTTNNTGITDKHPTNKEKAKLVDTLNKPLRKCAHASVYFILAILILYSLLNTFNSLTNKYYLAIIITIVLCFTYSLSDEYHQTFVSGRTGQFSDCLIDTAGSSLGTILYTLSHKIYTKRIKKKG